MHIKILTSAVQTQKSNATEYLNKMKSISGTEVVKTLSCSAQLRLKFILLINVKMPTIVCILTFISRINYCLMGFMPEFSTEFGYFSFYDLLKFHAELS